MNITNNETGIKVMTPHQMLECLSATGADGSVLDFVEREIQNETFTVEYFESAAWHAECLKSIVTFLRQVAETDIRSESEGLALITSVRGMALDDLHTGIYGTWTDEQKEYLADGVEAKLITYRCHMDKTLRDMCAKIVDLDYNGAENYTTSYELTDQGIATVLLHRILVRDTQQSELKLRAFNMYIIQKYCVPRVMSSFISDALDKN